MSELIRWLLQLWFLVSREISGLYKNKTALAMVILLPFIQALLFSYAINKDPKNLPTALVTYDNSPFVRSMVSGLVNSEYFNLIVTKDENEAQRMITMGKINGIITIPAAFSRDFIRGDHPQILLEYDATDSGTNNIVNNFSEVIKQKTSEYLQYGLNKPPATVNKSISNVDIVAHRSFNEENQSIYNTLPGLMGTLLTMVMLLGSVTLITQSKENGSFYELNKKGYSATSIVCGKAIPLLLVGSFHLGIILTIGKLCFGIYTLKNPGLLFLATQLFMWATITFGIVISSIAKSSAQALQFGIFFQMLSMYLSGGLYSYYAQPLVLRLLGGILPLTHYLLISRGLMLKNITVDLLLPNLIPIIIFASITTLIAIYSTKRNLKNHIRSE